MQENEYEDENEEVEESRKSYLDEPIYEIIYENSNNNDEFWNKNINLFYSIQILCLSSSLLCSLSLICLTFYINFNQKYQLINKLSNDIIYTTINKLVIGYLNYTFIFISIISLSLDLVQIYLFRKSRNFLNSYNTGFESITKNTEDNSVIIPLKLKKRIKTRRFRHKIRSFKLLIEFSNFVYNLIYIIFVVSLKFLIGIWLERHINEIVNNQIPITLWKLFKEFEGLIVDQKEIGSKEMYLVNHMQTKFECCHYLNPYQYNTYKILNCNLRTSCLKPVQYFFINTYYYILLFLLLSSSISLLFLILQFFNYRFILIKKLLYSYKSNV